MPFCPNCGGQISEDAKFCASCGTKIAPPAVEEPVYAPVVEEPVYAPVEEEPVYIPENQAAPIYVAPVETVEEPPVVERAKPEKVSLITKKPLGIGKKILVGFLWILAFVFGLATIATFCVRSAVNEDTIAMILEEVDLSEIAATALISNADEDDTIVDWLREELIARDPNWERLSTKDLEDFINTQIKPFLAEKAGEFLEVILTGKGEASIDKKDIRKLVENSVDFIEEEYGVTVTDAMADDLVEYIDSFTGEDGESFSEVASTEYLKEQYPNIMENIPVVASVLPMVIFGALTVIFLVLILVVNKSLIRNLNSVGSLATVLGAVYSIAMGAVLLVPDLLADLYGELEFIGTIVEQVASTCLMIALPLLGGGVLVLLISKLLQSIKVTKK